MATREQNDLDGWIEQSRTLIVLKPEGDPWERIETQAREDMAHKGRLYWAVESMIREQWWQKPPDARKAEDGETPCELCTGLASHVWHRTAKEIKASRVKRNGVVREVGPVSYRCPIHVPYWYADRYAEYVQGAAVGAAA
jgi:hypothetical protein